MKKHDITNGIIRLHEDSIMKKLVNEVKEELEKGDLDSHQSDLDQLLTRLKGKENQDKSNVISLKPTVKRKEHSSFYSVELLAAAGESIDVWHSQPIYFRDVGFTLDIRAVLGSSDEVELYISPISDKDSSGKSKIKETFLPLHNTNINITIECDGIQLLVGELYVDAVCESAEGMGKLENKELYNSVKGQLTFHILSKK